MVSKAAKKNVSAHNFIIFSFTLVALVVIVIILFLLNVFNTSTAGDNTAQGAVNSRENFVADESNADEIAKQLEELGRDNLFYVSLNGVWTFADGETASHDAIMENASQNTQDMFVTIVLEGSEDILYKSDVISPGEALSNIKLLRDLEPGIYEALAVHHPLYPDGTVETQINMRLKLVVEK